MANELWGVSLSNVSVQLRPSLNFDLRHDNFLLFLKKLECKWNEERDSRDCVERLVRMAELDVMMLPLMLPLEVERPMLQLENIRGREDFKSHRKLLPLPLLLLPLDDPAERSIIINSKKSLRVTVVHQMQLVCLTDGVVVWTWWTWWVVVVAMSNPRVNDALCICIQTGAWATPAPTRRSTRYQSSHLPSTLFLPRRRHRLMPRVRGNQNRYHSVAVTARIVKANRLGPLTISRRIMRNMKMEGKSPTVHS